MSALVSLESMADALVRKGLPAEYAERATAELVDHRRDIVDELRTLGLSAADADKEADNRIGDIHKLIKKLTREFRGRRFYGRWPIVTFILSPMLALYGVWILMAAICVYGSQFVASLLSRLHGSEPTLATVAEIKLFMGWITFNAIAPICLATLYTHLALRAGFGRRWAATSVVQIALFAGFLGWQADHANGRVILSVPVGVTASGGMRWIAAATGPWQLLQTAIPFAVLLAMIWIDHRRRATFLDPSARLGSLSA